MKFKEIAKKKNVTEHERNISEEIGNDIEKHFNDEINLYTNQQVLGMREVFIEVATKEWVPMTHESIYKSKQNKVLTQKGVSLYCVCWNQMCAVLNDLVV